ncbi:hypothetical protein V6N13_032988 [Hibiscus sabdariffa]
MECWRPCLSTLGFISRIGVKKWLLFKREEQRFNQTLVIVETSSPVATAFTSLGEDAVVHGNVCLESVGLMELLQDHCCNMNGLLDHNTNQWSWPSLTGLQSEKLHHGPLILGWGITVTFKKVMSYI